MTRLGFNPCFFCKYNATSCFHRMFKIQVVFASSVLHREVGQIISRLCSLSLHLLEQLYEADTISARSFQNTGIIHGSVSKAKISQQSFSNMKEPPEPVCRPMSVSSSKYVSKYSDPTFCEILSALSRRAVGRPCRSGTVNLSCTMEQA